MALSLFHWIGIGLVIAVVLIPVVRWFWKRFDMPSKFAIESIKRRKQEAKEAELWERIESQIRDDKREHEDFIERQKMKENNSGRSMNAFEAANAWSKLGVYSPLVPVKKPQKIETKISVESLSKDITHSRYSVEEPDWELIKRMSELSEPVDGVPKAPDLEIVES